MLINNWTELLCDGDINLRFPHSRGRSWFTLEDLIRLARMREEKAACSGQQTVD
jgi:hypothetical protein